MKIGSLCTGYGGLDLAVEEYFTAKTIWCAEIDKYALQVIEKRFAIPNYGNIKEINWADLPKIDILTAGYPCQPFSHAGERKGINDERHIWPYIKEAISIIRPSYVIMENVRGHLSLGFDQVLADLAQIGYAARWELIRASDVGAPHQRARIFIIAYPNGDACTQSRRANRNIHATPKEIINWTDRSINRASIEITSNSNNGYQSHVRQMQELGRRFTPRREMCLQTPPDPLDQDGKLNSKFVEYMMGLPKGWVTDIGLSRAQELKMLGNGVVPQQAYYALEKLETPF